MVDDIWDYHIQWHHLSGLGGALDLLLQNIVIIWFVTQGK